MRKKLKNDKRVHCIGFDMRIEEDEQVDMDVMPIILLQDIRQQTKKAWDCVQRYLRSGSFPDCKNIYVDGTYYSE